MKTNNFFLVLTAMVTLHTSVAASEITSSTQIPKIRESFIEFDKALADIQKDTVQLNELLKQMEKDTDDQPGDKHLESQEELPSRPRCCASLRKSLCNYGKNIRSATLVAKNLTREIIINSIPVANKFLPLILLNWANLYQNGQGNHPGQVYDCSGNMCILR